MAVNEPEVLEASEYISAREEALFARDLDGQLIRVTDATLNDLETSIKLTIDGQEIEIRKALPLRNSQGVIQCNEKGEPIPRPTTIYDAVNEKYVNQGGVENPIPILCHREHLVPAGVCRVCLVEIEERRKSGRVKKDLVSSCTYHVKEGMIVTTSASQEKPEAVQRIHSSVGVVVELLASEHLTEEDLKSVQQGLSTFEPNELKRLVRQFVNPSVNPVRFKPSHLHQKRGIDRSSEIIAVNHDACVLCLRCTRACNDIKENDVIGRSGKGYQTTIGFDLGVPMLESSCVSCGECVISCPTDALTFRPQVVEKQIAKIKQQIEKVGGLTADILTVDEMLQIPIFQGIPYKFLQFNGGACVRRRLKANDVLCRQGDYGATAYLIQSGKFEIQLNKKAAVNPDAAEASKNVKRGWLSFLGIDRLQSTGVVATPSNLTTGTDSVQSSNKTSGPIYRGVEDVILGEMACLNRYPRTATVIAVEESEVIEIGSNVLYMLQRNASSRKLLNDAYRRHALNSDLVKLPIFKSLSPEGRAEAAKLISNSVELVSVEPGQPIFKQGEMSDDFYLVRLGYVKVSRQNGTREQVINYLGPDGRDGEVGSFGEISALSNLYADELRSDLVRLNYQAGIRTSTCSALDHVELVRIKSQDLKRIADRNPAFKLQLLDRAKFLLKLDSQRDSTLSSNKTNFVEQGLYNAQSLLVLDLESCTRCDECTRACADSHGGESRLIREGLRFENFLVATSCRSCTDPYCLVGCPVNAIFREGTKEIVIEDHCIGCGLCASNCPYGNISMYGHQEGVRQEGKKQIPVIRQKATTCDQCKSLDGDPRCVYSCPHNAAFRMSGNELKERVAAKLTIVSR
ncbi:MAG: cyclic nucleotide-binding domain-containing protein [Pirellulaceae bacterium]|nr:cyclic nucleotide-binding domain-containing protein [Pirellulaceae bacterium]